MSSGISTPTRLYLGLVAFSLAGSLLQRLTGLEPHLIKPIASLLVLGLGVWALALPLVPSLGTPRTAMVVGVVLLIGTLFEIFGLYTGIPFGRYAYTAVWQPVLSISGGQFFPVPLPFAWFLLAGGCFMLASQGLAGVWAVPAGALLATVIDLCMEPVMVNSLGYWTWLEPGPLPGGAPLLNPVGWFVTSLVAGAVLHRFGAGRAKATHAPGYVVAGFIALVAGLALIQVLPGPTQ